MDNNNEFRNWMLENEDNPELDIVMRRLLEASASDDQPMAKDGFADFKNKTGLHKSEFWAKCRYYAVRIAACLFFPLLFLCGWAVHRVSVSDQAWVKVSTTVAQTSNVTLPDGTKVLLSPCSQLFYPERFSGNQRKVMLVGEAYLDVAKDTRHQFVVSAGQMDVIVHGTRFSVSSFPEENEEEVALVEGSVEMRFDSEEGSIFLSPGELVKYDRSTGTTERRKFAANYFEEVVRSGGLQFRNERLEDIVASLNRHFNVTIVIEDRSLADERFFASFINGEDADEILSALNTGDIFRLQKRDNITYLTK
jgi:ferric-dicitrate binding protein FerR (iron transport regulator)